MDDQAERLKKLKAGKEKLAAFQKKKIKKKKKNEVNSEGVSGVEEECLKESPNVSHSEEQLLAAAPTTSVHTDEDVLPTDSSVLPSPVFDTSTTTTLGLSQSDIAGASGDHESSLEEPERQQLFETAQLELREASSKICKLEESVIGKQKAVERLVAEINSLRAENEMLKQSLGNGPSQDLNALDPASKFEPGHQRDLTLRIQELENAILKRDELLRQLTSRLQMSFQENTERGLQQACSVETQKLAQHVQLLQLQLQQAGEKLNGQMKQHSVSSQALQDAKCEILNLHQRIQQKDEMMSQLTQKLSQVNNNYASLQSTMALSDQQSTDYNQLLTELNILHEQSNTLSLHLNEEKAKNSQLEKRLMQVLQPNVNESASSGSHLESTAEGTVAEMELTSENLPEYFPRKQLEEFHRLIEKCIFLYQSSDNTSDNSTATTTTSSNSSSSSSCEELNRLLLKITCITQVFLKNIKTDSFQRSDLDRDFACQVNLGEPFELASNNSEIPSPNAVAINENLGANSVLAENKELLSNAETLQLKIEDLSAENKLLSEEVFQTKTKFDSLLAVKEELDEKCQASESKTSELITKLEHYETEINSLQEKNSNLTACLKDLEVSFGSVKESEMSLTQNVAVLKSEKEALNACLQEKDRDVQDLTERLESSHQEIMNLENMRRTLEQELSVSRQETVDFNDKLNRHGTEAEEQKQNELNLLEKLASSQEEITALQQQMASMEDEKKETLKLAAMEVVELNEDIAALRNQIAELEENNSQQMKKMADQHTHLEEVNLQVSELSARFEETKLTNQSLTREKDTLNQWNASLGEQFSKIASLVKLVIGEDTEGLNLSTMSNDEDLVKVEAVVNEMSSKVTKHKENLLRLESENKSLAEFRIHEKEEADKIMNERANEISLYQETVSALEAEKQSLSQNLVAAGNNCKAKDLEVERLKCVVESLQVTESTKERFAEMDTLLVQRQQEVSQLTEELTSLKQSSSKDLATLRKSIEEFEGKVQGKDECVRNLTHQLDEEKELAIRLTQQLEEEKELAIRLTQQLDEEKELAIHLTQQSDSQAEEIEKLKLQISSLLETGKHAKVNFEESNSKIEKFENEIAKLKSVNESYQQELEKVTLDKKTLESSFEELKSNYSALECDYTELKQSLDKIESEKKQLISVNEDLSKVAEEKNKLLQELEEFHTKEKEAIQKMNENLKTEMEALESDKNHLQNVYDQTVQSLLDNQEKLHKLNEEHLALEDHFKVQSEEFVQMKKEFEESKEASLKTIADLEKSLLEVESNASSEKASMNKEVQELLAMKESLLVKIEELSRSSGSGEAQLLASREAVSQVLGKANDELESFKELWSIEKTELCNKIRSLSADLENSQQEKNGLQQERGRLQQERGRLQQENERLQPENERLRHEMNDFQKTIEQLHHENLGLQHQKEELQYETENFRDKNNSLQHGKDGMPQERGSLQQEIIDLQDLQLEKNSWLQEKESLQQECENLQREKDTLLQKNTNLQQEKNFLLQENTSLQLKEEQQVSKIDLVAENQGLQSKEKKGFENEDLQSEERKGFENEGLRWDNDDLQPHQQELRLSCLQASVVQTCEANPRVPESFVSKDLGSHTAKRQSVEVPLEKFREECGTTVGSSKGEGSGNTFVNGTETSLSAVDTLENYKEQLEMMAEKYEMELKYVRLNILSELAEEKENFEKEVEQRYCLKLESVKAENDRMFIENLQQVRSDLELKHKQELNELRVSVMKECQSMSPQELDTKLYGIMHDLHAENQQCMHGKTDVKQHLLHHRDLAEKLAESRDSLLKQIELLNTQYEQIQEEHFSLWSKRSKKPMSSSPRAKRKFDTLPQDIESASRSLVEISQAKGCFDNEEKTCTKLDCQGYRKRYEIALKILTEKGLTSLDNISEKSSFEVDSLDGSASMGDQPREELSMELQDEYNELMERTVTEPVLSSTFQRKSSPELQCPNCISLAEERLSLKKRLSTQLELFGKERFHLLSRCENLSNELENVQLTRDQLQTELNITKEVQRGQDRHPSEVELTDIKVKLANTEDQVVFYQNKLSQSEVEHQELKSKINELFVKVIDQQHYINNLEEEYSRSRDGWNHKGTMTSMDNGKIELAPVGGRRHSEPNNNVRDVDHEMEHHHPIPQHLSQSSNNISLESNFANIPQMPSLKSPKSDRETSPDSLNKSSLSDNSSPAGDRDNWINYHSEHSNRNNSSPALNQSDRYSDSLASPPKLTRSTQSSPSLLLLNKEFRESEKILSEFQLDQGDFLFVQDKQIELIDEIAELKRSLLQSKEDHVKEIATIKEKIDRFKKVKGLCDTQNLLDILDSTDTISLSVDVVDLREKVSLLRETCNRLTEDNKDLQKKLYNQECLVMKAKMLQTNPKHSVTAEDLETSFGSQLLLLQKHRDELADKLSEERLLENQFTEVVAAKTSLDEHLHREKEHVQQLTEKVQIAEAELSSKKAECDYMLQQQLRLEELIRDKEEVEKQLMSEKFILESQLTQTNYELETKERHLRDIEQRVNKCASEISPETGVTAGNDNQLNDIELQEKFTQELNEAKLVIEKQNIDRLEALRKDMDEHHKRAVEYLRQQLRSDFSMRESRLEEHHSAHVASLHSIHAEQLQSLKDEYERQMEDLKQEFYDERIKHVRSNTSESQASGSSEMDEGSNGAVDNKQEQILDELRKDLTEDQQHKLELVISQIVKQHKAHLDQLTSHYKDELNLRIKATRLTAEQLHKSEAELMKAALEEKKQNELAELRDILARYHNEETDRREGEWSSHLERLRQQYDYQLAIGQEPAPKGAVGTLEGATLVTELTKRLNDEHKKLIEAFVGMGKPSLGLKWLAVSSVTEPWMSSFFDIIVTDQDVNHLREVISKDLVAPSNSQTPPEDIVNCPSRSITSATPIDSHGDSGGGRDTSGAADASTSHWRLNDSNSNSGDAIYKCLEEQKDEILLLRSRILREYEQLLKARTDSMVTESSKDIFNLQDEIDALQQQHEIQISTMRQGIGKRMSAEYTGESSLSQSLDEDQRQTLSKLLSHYETKVHSIEERFNHHMGKLKSQIEHDLSASFGDFSGELDQDLSFGKMSLNKTGRFPQLAHQTHQFAEFSASSVEQHVPVDSQIVAEEAYVLNDSNNSSLVRSSSDEAVMRSGTDEHRYVSNVNSATDVKTFQEELDHLQNQYAEIAASESHLPKDKAEMTSVHEKVLKAQEQLLEQEHKLEMDALQSECDIKLQVELKKQAIELLTKFQAGLQSNDQGKMTLKRCDSFERELVKRTMTDGQFDSYDASDSNQNRAGAKKERLGVPFLSSVLGSRNKQDNSNSLVADHEARIASMQAEFEQRLKKLRKELTELGEKEKREITTKFKNEIANLESQLSDNEEKYENLMDDLRSGKIPEVAQLMHEKYDSELEFAKTLMQQEFDESLEGEQFRLKEHQEKQIEELLCEKTKEMKELQQKYEGNLALLQETLKRYEDHTSAKDDTDNSNVGNKQQQQQQQQKHQDEQLRSLRQQLEEKDKVIEAERKSLQENYNQELEKLREKYELKLGEQQKHLTENHDDQLSAMVIHSDAIKSELDEAHQAELEQVREQLSSKHSKMMDNLNKKHQMNIEELERQFQVKIEELEIRHQLEVECLKKEMESPDAKEEPCISTTNVGIQLQQQQQSVSKDENTDPTGRDVIEAPLSKSYADIVKSSLPEPEPVSQTQSTHHKYHDIIVPQRSGQLQQCQLVADHVVPQESGVVQSSPSKQVTKKEIYEETNKQLLQHLSNLVRTYLDIEDSINKKLSQVLADSKNASERGSRSNHLGIPQSTSDNDSSLSKRQKRRYKSAERLDLGNWVLENPSNVSHEPTRWIPSIRLPLTNTFQRNIKFLKCYAHRLKKTEKMICTLPIQDQATQMKVWYSPSSLAVISSLGLVWTAIVKN
ncbi:uncharacterized protein LOC118760840 isoform X6 [Octopus sinensis]|uniref:Uncharacterized protein LOC118760840 isoform X6 n=1 Tax=Octopus sinensis TaxID=2607531 RepID=A0A7E6F330_9MOLL|nr:uncharacterized protein LOC118760840 isoform X6 [Octopus sinensis]